MHIYGMVRWNMKDGMLEAQSCNCWCNLIPLWMPLWDGLYLQMVKLDRLGHGLLNHWVYQLYPTIIGINYVKPPIWAWFIRTIYGDDWGFMALLYPYYSVLAYPVLAHTSTIAFDPPSRLPNPWGYVTPFPYTLAVDLQEFVDVLFWWFWTLSILCWRRYPQYSQWLVTLAHFHTLILCLFLLFFSPDISVLKRLWQSNMAIPPPVATGSHVPMKLVLSAVH